MFILDFGYHISYVSALLTPRRRQFPHSDSFGGGGYLDYSTLFFHALFSFSMTSIYSEVYSLGTS